MYLGVGMYIVLERGDEMNTVASFIRPFIRLFSFVFRSTDHTAQLHSGRKKPKRKRKQKTKGGSRVHNSRGLNTRDNIYETSEDSKLIQNDSNGQWSSYLFMSDMHPNKCTLGDPLDHLRSIHFFRIFFQTSVQLRAAHGQLVR